MISIKTDAITYPNMLNIVLEKCLRSSLKTYLISILFYYCIQLVAK
jgi:hypothetical protein